ncbi:MAG TPA: hypothetical protein VN815_00815 [Steroidobacteraceae bacterium]|nr:hypothetical protein [Steroidobacteraceae bacterium]
MSEHTPTPWFVMGNSIQTKGGNYIADLSSPRGSQERDANAAFIVKAVNNHDALVEALTECLDVLQSKEMMGVWGFLYTHGFKWTGKVLDCNALRGLVGSPK